MTSMASIAARIPPELFKDILAFVGDGNRLGNDGIFDAFPYNDPATRREEMQHLSVCALTCVFWAQLIRSRMFESLVLRSPGDMHDLLSLLRTSQSPRIPTISDSLRHLHIYYTLGDQPWFHYLSGLKAYNRILRSGAVFLRIIGPATPAFRTACTRGSVLHPLFFATPRVLPISPPPNCHLYFIVQNIYSHDPTVLFNLLQDCLLLRPKGIHCSNLTWDSDPALPATPTTVGFKYACRGNEDVTLSASGCTDSILVASMMQSVPHHPLSQRPQGPHLSFQDTSHLFDMMHVSAAKLPTQRHEQSSHCISSNSRVEAIQKYVVVRLPLGIDFSLEWTVDRFIFRCIGFRQPDAVIANSAICNIIYVTIDLSLFDDPTELREEMKTTRIDWNSFLLSIQEFPYLQQIVVQCGLDYIPISHPREILVQFVAYMMGGAWTTLGGLLGLYYRDDGAGESNWIQIELGSVVDDVDSKRAELVNESAAPIAGFSDFEAFLEEGHPSYAELLRGWGPDTIE